MLALLFIFCCLVLVAAYRFYGRFMARRLDVCNERATPAHRMRDGIDYEATSTPVLFGHHFSSIAGAGPIVGPIIAAFAFGWFPALLWIMLGAIFVGGVHDYTSLIASVRHHARSIGQMCRTLLSPLAYRLFLVFIWFTLVYVLIVFLDLTSTSFAPVLPPGLAADAARDAMLQGGTVATAAVFYIFLAMAFGIALKRFRMRILAATVIFVPLVFSGLWLGRVIPLTADYIPSFLGSPRYTWNLILLAYCFTASVLPVWLLLQPRDYLSSFLLYACLLGGAAGLILSGAKGAAVINYPAFIGWQDAQLGFIFPSLFVIIACGAVSGFHSIVASGTTAKQLPSESSAQPVAYGGMLVEAMLALLSLAAVMVLKNRSSAQPAAVFAEGLGSFLASFGFSKSAAVAFAMLALSTFLLTTLDTCTRLSRFIFEELFGLSGRIGRYAGSLAALALPALTVFRQIPGPGGKMMPVWQAIWPAFGATNQLLAALALMVVYAWLRQEGRRAWFVIAPMLLMQVTSITALTQLVIGNLFRNGSLVVGSLSLLLDALAVFLIVNTFWNMRRRKTQRQPVHAGPQQTPA